MRSTRAMWSVVGLIVIAIGLLIWQVILPAPTVVYKPRPECPQGGQWRKVFVPDSGGPPFGPTINGELTLSRDITEIVEFHDCQQFIVPDETSGGLRYTSLVAIFARKNLGRAYSYEQARGGAVQFDPRTMGTPMATILAYDSAYVPLGIQSGLNCLYFFQSQGDTSLQYQARVVPVQVEAECAIPLQPTDTRGTSLAVTSAPARDTPPPVARWDWDAAQKKQYIGIRCGSEWCEVHPRGEPSVVGDNFSSSTPLRELGARSKGWYDEQILTLADAPASPTMGGPSGDARPQVSAIVGTFIPALNLGNWSGKPETSPFAQGWTAVATVAIRGNPGGYTSKLNLIESGESIATNVVYLCYSGVANPGACTGSGTLNCASDQWYAKVVHNPNSPSPVSKHFCATRRGHDGPGMPAIPGVVRWRWLLNDETMWVRCLNGCCEVNAT
jgi:hypothetical protein